ncbi:MAG: hypothetical protein RL745_3 [Actinomycetota bacterium]
MLSAQARTFSHVEQPGTPHSPGSPPSNGAIGVVAATPSAAAATSPSMSIEGGAGVSPSAVSLTAGIDLPVQGGERDIAEGKLLTPAEVASLFGVDPRTVSRWSDRGVLKAIFTPGGHRRYRYLDVMALRDSLARGN